MDKATVNKVGVVSCHLAGFEPHNRIIIEEVIERVAGYGIEEIEWFVALWFEEQFGKNIFERIRALCRKTGIQSSYHAPWQAEWDLGRIGRQAGRRALAAMLDMAEKLEAATMTIHCGTYPRADDSAAESRANARENVVGILTDSLCELERRKIHICVENNTGCHEPNVIGERLDDFTYLFSQIDSPLIGFNLDVGHSTIMGDTDGYLDKFGPRLSHTHLHDTDGVTDGHLPPGRGIVSWESFFAKLKAVNYSGTLALEFPEASGEYPRFIEQCARFREVEHPAPNAE